MTTPRATSRRTARWLVGLVTVGAMALAALGARAEPVFSELTGELGMEGRWFPSSPLHEGQRPNGLSFYAEPELYLEDEDGHALVVAPFFRYDTADARRTHWDLREAYGLFFGELEDGEWELRIGFDKVFWGVAESRHLVDIINQTDLIEDPDQEEKLGQPMIHGTWVADHGVLEAFLLPYFRDRTFQGRGGRLRNTFVVDTDQTTYESSAGRHHMDIALRYSNTIDIFDFGLAVFDGTNRAPTLSLGLDRNGGVALIPTYEQIRQFSVDAQATTGPWLLKLEAYWRDGEKDRAAIEDDYGAFVTGFEYTLYGIWESDADLGFIGELLVDERDDRALSPFENDIFAAVRLALNDVESTELLAGAIQDLNQSSRTFFVEASRRIDDNWSVELAGTAFLEVDDADVQFPLRRDHVIELTTSYNF